jgi:hypothetical protein
MRLVYWCLLGLCTAGYASIPPFASEARIAAGLDTQDRKMMERSSPRTVDRMDRGEPLTLNDVIKLSQSGVNDDSIIQYMQTTKSSYHLSQTQIRRLQDAGVSQRIIDFMVDSDQF